MSEMELDFHFGWISLAGCMGMGLESGSRESVRKAAAIVQVRDGGGSSC